jgi:hypothetical protein
VPSAQRKVPESTPTRARPQAQAHVPSSVPRPATPAKPARTPSVNKAPAAKIDPISGKNIASARPLPLFFELDGPTPDELSKQKEAPLSFYKTHFMQRHVPAKNMGVSSDTGSETASSSAPRLHKKKSRYSKVRFKHSNNVVNELPERAWQKVIIGGDEVWADKDGRTVLRSSFPNGSDVFNKKAIRGGGPGWQDQFGNLLIDADLKHEKPWVDDRSIPRGGDSRFFEGYELITPKGRYVPAPEVQVDVPQRPGRPAKTATMAFEPHQTDTYMRAGEFEEKAAKRKSRRR